MKFTILINQRAVVENGLNLDIIDLAIFDFIKDFTHAEGTCKVLYHNGKPYYWISYKLIIDEMPMLGIGSKDAIYRRVKKLINEDVLRAHPDNQELQQTYFGFGKMYERLVFKTEPTAQTPNNLPLSDRTPTDETLNNKTIKDKTIKISIKNSASFYSRQVKLNENETLLSKYITIVKYLLGENVLKIPIEHILKLNSQLTFAEFKKLNTAAFAKNLELVDLLDSWLNNPKYSKGKVSIYLTLNNWINRATGKPHQPKETYKKIEYPRSGKTQSLQELITKLTINNLKQ